ncbi:oligosaccharide flippase family protein [Nocardioides speluncae]|uniref:oligosaccharide flippase family protein n=1 Tax=Nocardioides speluncae TaxID=2670337 RepID=UPI0012B168EA|nr:oligosaccharide flippase family protein [Nocardioides speluncae]
MWERMARGGSLNLVGAVCQQAAQLLTIALIARMLGADDLGRYVLVYAVLMLLQLTALFGFRATLTRFIAMRLADDDGGRVRATIRFSLVVTTIAAVVLAVALALASGGFASVFHDDDMRLGFVLAAVALPAITLRDACLAATQGWRTQRDFTLIGWIGEPVARLALTGLALAAGWGLEGAFLALVVSSWGSAVAAARALRRKLKTVVRGTGGTGDPGRRELLSFSFTSWGTTLASTGLIWAGTLMLGNLANTAAVGEYSVATRLVSLAVFVMAPINAAFAPQFAHLHHRGEIDELGSAYVAATGWIVRLSLPAFVVLLVFPRELLGLFGPGYVDAVAVTVLLAVGQLVNAISGPCGTLLNMAGRVRLNLVNNIVVLVLNIVLNLLLIPPYGIVGAAIAWTAALAVVNLARLVQVRLVLGIHPFRRVIAKAAAAAVLAAGAALTVRALMSSGLGAAVVGSCVLVVVYAAVTLRLGLGQDERSALGALRRSPDATVE